MFESQVSVALDKPIVGSRAANNPLQIKFSLTHDHNETSKKNSK